MMNRKKRSQKKRTNVLLKLLGIVFMLFTGTFIIYFFNLDMKLTAMIEPWLLKHYDKIPRDRHL